MLSSLQPLVQISTGLYSLHQTIPATSNHHGSLASPPYQILQTRNHHKTISIITPLHSNPIPAVGFNVLITTMAAQSMLSSPPPNTKTCNSQSQVFSPHGLTLSNQSQKTHNHQITFSAPFIQLTCNSAKKSNTTARSPVLHSLRPHLQFRAHARLTATELAAFSAPIDLPQVAITAHQSQARVPPP
jgi:hypothetical protein